MSQCRKYKANSYITKTIQNGRTCRNIQIAVTWTQDTSHNEQSVWLQLPRRWMRRSILARTTEPDVTLRSFPTLPTNARDFKEVRARQMSNVRVGVYWCTAFVSVVMDINYNVVAVVRSHTDFMGICLNLQHQKGHDYEKYTDHLASVIGEGCGGVATCSPQHTKSPIVHHWSTRTFPCSLQRIPTGSRRWKIQRGPHWCSEL